MIDRENQFENIDETISRIHEGHHNFVNHPTGEIPKLRMNTPEPKHKPEPLQTAPTRELATEPIKIKPIPRPKHPITNHRQDLPGHNENPQISPQPVESNNSQPNEFQKIMQEFIDNQSNDNDKIIWLKNQIDNGTISTDDANTIVLKHFQQLIHNIEPDKLIQAQNYRSNVFKNLAEIIGLTKQSKDTLIQFTQELIQNNNLDCLYNTFDFNTKDYRNIYKGIFEISDIPSLQKILEELTLQEVPVSIIEILVDLQEISKTEASIKFKQLADKIFTYSEGIDRGEAIGEILCYGLRCQAIQPQEFINYANRLYVNHVPSIMEASFRINAFTHHEARQHCINYMERFYNNMQDENKWDDLTNLESLVKMLELANEFNLLQLTDKNLICKYIDISESNTFSTIQDAQLRLLNAAIGSNLFKPTELRSNYDSLLQKLFHKQKADVYLSGLKFKIYDIKDAKQIIQYCDDDITEMIKKYKHLVGTIYPKYILLLQSISDLYTEIGNNQSANLVDNKIRWIEETEKTAGKKPKNPYPHS